MKILHKDTNYYSFELFPSRVNMFILVYFILGYAAIVYYDNIWTIIFCGIFLIAYSFNTAKIYLLPLRVTIDKHANKINIFDFGVPKKNVNFPFINGTPISIDIDQLQQITFVDGHLFANISSAKNNDQFNFSFILRNNTSISLQSGTFVYSAHRIACMQIAEYLSIPFEDQIHKLSVLADHGSINTTIKIKNILFKILFVLLFLLLLIIITLLVAIYR